MLALAVTLFLTSGARRVVPEGDAAQMDGTFFMVTRFDTRLERIRTVLTLRSTDVISAEIQRADGTTEFVRGAGISA